MENKELMSEWKKNSIRIGTPTNLLAAFTSFIPVIWLCITYNCWPDPKVVLAGWGMVALSFGAFYVVEPISYYAALGLTGTYLSFLSGISVTCEFHVQQWLLKRRRVNQERFRQRWLLQWQSVFYYYKPDRYNSSCFSRISSCIRTSRCYCIRSYKICSRCNFRRNFWNLCIEIS